MLAQHGIVHKTLVSGRSMPTLTDLQTLRERELTT